MALWWLPLFVWHHWATLYPVITIEIGALCIMMSQTEGRPHSQAKEGRSMVS